MSSRAALMARMCDGQSLELIIPAGKTPDGYMQAIIDRTTPAGVTPDQWLPLTSGGFARIAHVISLSIIELE